MKFEHIKTGFEEGINPSNDGRGWETRKRVKLYLVQDGVELEQLSASMSFDEDMSPKLTIRENRMEIGYGEYLQRSDGSIELKLTLVGDTTMKSNNLPGLTQLDVFIPASLRKD